MQVISQSTTYLPNVWMFFPAERIGIDEVCHRALVWNKKKCNPCGRSRGLPLTVSMILSQKVSFFQDLK